MGRTHKPDYIVLSTLFLGAGAAIIVGKLVFVRTLSARVGAIASPDNRLIYQEPGAQVYEYVILIKKKFSAVEIDKQQITEIKKVTKVKKTSDGVPGRVDQGIEIKYRRGQRTSSVIFRSEDRDKLFTKLEEAGYRVVWTPT